jgi:hypothetical protein
MRAYQNAGKNGAEKKRDAHIPEFAHLKPVKMENVLLTGATVIWVRI